MSYFIMWLATTVSIIALVLCVIVSVWPYRDTILQVFDHWFDDKENEDA